MGKTRNGILITIIMALVCAATLLCGTAAVHAEGSRDLVRTSAENYKAVTSSDGTTGANQARWSLMSQSGNFMGVNRQQKIKFYAFEGETVFLASNEVDNSVDIKMTQPDGSVVNVDLKTDEGFIKTSANEKAGPKAEDGKSIWLPKAETVRTGSIEYDNSDTNRYTAYKYDIPISGVYVLEFYTNTIKATTSAANGSNTAGDIRFSTELDGAHSKAHVIAWDVTVAQPQKSGDDITHYVAVNGRVWMDAIAMQNMGGVYGDLYCVTRDGYIWRFSLNGISPNTFAMYANSRGGIGSGTNASAYHSIHSPLTNYTGFNAYKNLKDKNGNPDGILILGPDNEVTDIDSPYHMFLNYPDTTVSDSIVQSVPQSLGRVESIRYDGKSGDEDDTGTKTENDDGFAGVGGYFEVNTKGVTSYQIIIDMSNMYAKNYHGETVDNKKFDEDQEKYGNEHDEEICLSTDTDNNFIYYANGNWYTIKTGNNDKTNRHPTNTDDTGTVEAMDRYVTYENVDIDGITGDPSSDSGTQEALSDAGYKSLGKIMLGNAAVDGVNRIKWDGRDQYGRILPIGSYFGSTGRGKVYAEPKAGEIHFPLGDVENMDNGVAIWLENPDSATDWLYENKTPSASEQITARSKIYYNNFDQSLLRDFTVKNMPNEGAGDTNDGNYTNATSWGNNAWYWNLPNNMLNSKSGQIGRKGENGTHYNEEKLNRTWVTEGATFEDKSIEGVASYEYNAAGGSSGSVEERKPTKKASQFPSCGTDTNIEGQQNATRGCDHGVVDLWSYITAPASKGYQVELKNSVTINGLDNQKVITGFVFLDTTNAANGHGRYDKLTDDRELPGATVVAEYGKKSNIDKGDTRDDSPVVYTTATNSNGYYSIPINMAAFDPSDTEMSVKITVKYSDSKAGDSVITHQITTDHDGTYKDNVVKRNLVQSQNVGDTANVSVQTINLYQKDKNDRTALKEIYAEDVGYVINPSTSLRVHADWTPDCLKDMSMAANFSVYGVYLSKIQDNSKIQKLLDKELSLSDADDKNQYICPSVSGKYQKLTVEELQEIKQFFEKEENCVYKKTDITLDFKLSAISTIEDLPGTTFKIQKEGEKSSIVADQKIVYRVFYNGDAPASSVGLSRNMYSAGSTKNYDNWDFTINTEPSVLNETVWYDANHNTVIDEGEQGIEGARIQIAKRLANIDGEANNPEYYMSEFERVKKNPSPTSSADEWILDPIKIDAENTVFITDKDGNVINKPYAYNPEDNTYTEEAPADDDEKSQGIHGLIAGRYKVTITLPPGSTYNTAAFTGDGLPDGLSGASTITASYDPENNQIVQYIDVPANATGDTSIKSRAAYSYMAGLSIFKNVEPYNTTEEAINKYVAPSLFAYKISLSNILIPEGEDEAEIVIPVEDAVTNPNGVEGVGNNNKKLHFKKRDGDADPSAVFTLKAGERITIGNLPNGTKYTVTELDKDPLLAGMTQDEIEKINDEEFPELAPGSTETTRNELLRVFERKKNMATGFSISPALNNKLSRKGEISETARTAFINFTNKYQPLQVTAYAGDTDLSLDPEIVVGTNHNLININARVLLGGREFKKSDEFGLALEPSTWFVRETTGQPDNEIHTLQEGLSPDVVMEPGSKITHTTIDTNITEDGGNETEVKFDKSYTMTFTQPGVYSYVLRERKPFTTDNIEPIAGVKYSDDSYKLYIDVTDDANTGHLVVSSYFWRAKTGSFDLGTAGRIDDWDSQWNTPIIGANTAAPTQNMNKPPVFGESFGAKQGKSMLVFNNTYDLTPPEVAFEGTKILNGRALGDKEFEFKIEPVGRYVIGHTENKTPDVIASMPTPESDTTWNTAATGTNNIKFDPITFTEDDAGEDEASAMIYHYQISEIKPEDGTAKPSVEYDTKKQDVYVRVYKEVVADPDPKHEGQFYQIVHALQCDADGNSTSGFAFTNSYTAKNLELSLSGDNSLGLKLKKTLISKEDSSRKFKDGDEFRFVIEPENGAPAISGGADGRPAGVLIFRPEGEDIGTTEKTDIRFENVDKIEFTEANTKDKPYYEYTIRELNPYGDASVTALPGISYDGTRYRLCVYVKDETTQGKLVLDKESSKSKTGIDLYKITDEQPDGVLLNGSTAAMPELEFTNNYDPNRIDVPLSANKSFNRDFTTFFGTAEGTENMNQGFGFTLTPIGSVDLSNPETLTEFKPGTQSGDGEYSSEANMPMPKVGKQYTEASKIFYIDSTGLIDLKNMTFESEDAGTTKANAKVYIYKIKENNENRGGVTYDSDDRYIFLSVYMLTDDTMGDTQYVNVALNDAEDITKIAEKHSEYQDANIDYTFVNTYNAKGSEFDLSNLDSLKIIKKVTTQNVDAPKFTEGQFKVKLEPFNSSNSQLPPGFNNEDGYVTFNIDASGNFVFDEHDNSYEVDSTKLNGTRLMFDSEGTYEYLIREVTPAEDGIDGEDGYTYDTYQYKLTLDVEDDLHGNMKITPSVQWRSSLGASWSSVFDESLDDTHMPEGYKDREDNNIKTTDIVFVNSYTQQHTLNYNPNGALSGSENLPPQAEYEKDTEITVYKTEGTLTRNPGEMFVGWSTYEKDGGSYTDEERNAALTAEDAEKAKTLNILSADDDGTDEDPGNIENNIFTMPDANAILYAVWAIDANGNNIPDYDEDGYSVEYYIGNAVVDPETEYVDKDNKILYTCAHHHVAGTEADFLSHKGNIVTVNGKDVKLSLPDSGNPAFIGWSLASSYIETPVVDAYPGVFSRENLSGLISSINLTEELMKNTDLIKTREDGRKILTVYAVWAGDTHGGQVLPPSEPTLGPDETPRPTADPDATPSPTATPGPETSDGIPDFKQVAYRGNRPADADQEVVGVPVDGNEYIPGESYVSLLTAPSLDGYRFLGWTDVETPTDGTIYYQPGMLWGPKTNKLDLFYAQWAKNEQSLIIQVFDDLNNDGVYEGDGALLNISAEKVIMTPKNGGEAVESEARIEGGGVQFTKERLKPGEYTLTVTIDEQQFDAYDRYTGVNYALGDEQGTITTKLEGTKLTINQDITIPYEDYSGAIRYGVTRPYDVIYNMNGAPVEVGLKEEAVPDKDYAYHDGDGEYYTDTTVNPNRVYDGKVEILGPDDLNDTMVSDGNGGYVFTDSAGIPHRFLGWSVDPTAAAPDEGVTAAELAQGGSNRGKSFYNMTAGDLTLYAVWNRGFSQYPLTLDSNGGTFESGTDNVGTLIDENHYVLVSDKDTYVPLDETTNWPGVQDQDKYNVPNITRENAVFVGWSLTPVGGLVNDYNLIKDSLLSSIQMLTANTVYAVWAEDTRGRLVDSDGTGCDTPNLYYGDAHSGCVDSGGNPKHGALRKHESDGIADYLQVFYEFNPPTDAEISGSLNTDPVTYGTDGKYTLDSDVLGTFSGTDAAGIVERDYTGKGLQSPAELPDPNAKAYIRSSSLAVKGYAFDGWSRNDPSGSTGKAPNGLFYAGPTNGLGRDYSFEKSAGRPDTFYAIWRKIVPAIVNIKVYNDANRNGVYDLDEPLISGFSLSDVKEVIMQPNGSELTDPNVPAHDDKDNGTGNIVISNFEESVYEMTLTLDNSDENSKYVTRTNGVGTHFAYSAGPDVETLELKADKSGERSVKFRYRAKEEFVGDLYVAVTEGHAITYDINGADSDKVTAPKIQDKLYYDIEYAIAECPSGPDGTQLSEDEQGLYYTDDRGVKRYFMGWSANMYQPEPEYPVGGDHKVNSKIKITGDMTLYAVWSADRYRVVYDLNGGSGTVPDEYAGKTYGFGENAALYIPLADERPTKNDVVFVGWSETAVNDALTASPDYGTIVTSVELQNADKTVYAVWAEDKDGDKVPDYADNMYLVKYHTNGGTFPITTNGIFLEDYSRYRLSGQTAELISIDEGRQRVMRGGAVLVGWGKTPHSELVASAAELAELSADSVYLTFAESDITVYALWAADENSNGVPDYKENPRTLKYDKNGGSGEAPASVGGLLPGDSVELEKTPAITLTDAVFIGWSRQQSVVSAEGNPVIFKSAPDEGVITESVTVADDDENEIIVYAAWAADTNHNGVPDYNETPHTLTYDANGGSGKVPDPVTVLPGISIALESEDNVDLTKENAKFVGWSLTEYSKLITSLEEENALRIDEYTMGDQNVTVYALYAADLDHNGEADYGRFKVLYDKNGAESGEAPTDNNLYSTGTAVTLKTPAANMTLPGAMFIGWSSNKNAVSASGGKPMIFTEAPADGIVETEVMIGSANVTVYAVWAADANNNGVPDYDEFYTVDYDTNGAPDSIKAPTAHTGLAHNGIIQIKDITEGLSTDGEGRYYTDGNGVKVYFEGWSKDAHAEKADADLAPGKYLSLNSANVTLHAVWRADRFKVLYYIGGELDSKYVSDDFRGKTYVYAETAALWMPVSEAQLPAGAAGTVFAGWTDNKGTAEKVLTEVPAAGTLVTSVNIPNRDVPVYAVWAEDKDGDKIPDYADSMYLVKYHSNGGFPDPEDHIFFADYTRYYITGAAAELIDFETEGRQRVSLEGAVLVGWGKEAHGELVKSDEELAGLLADNAYLTFGSDNITVYALWAADENGNGKPDYSESRYTLSYDPNGGEGSVPAARENLLTGNSVELEKNPGLTMTDAMFIGWSAEKAAVQNEDGSAKIFTDAAPHDGVLSDTVKIDDQNVTVYAVWAADTNHNGMPDYNEKPHTLSYNANDGEGTVPSAVPDLLPGTDVRLDMASGLTKSGGVFVGWSLTKYPKLMTSAEEEAALRIKNDTYTMGFDDVTVFALYAADSNGDNVPDYGRYTVTYDKNGAEGSEPVDTNKYSTGSVIRLVQPGADMRLADAVFIGWSENKAAVQDENGSAKIFDTAPESGTITDSVTITTNDVTVYAVWAADKNNNGTPDYNEGYTVSYNANGAPDSVKMPDAQTGLAYNASIKAGDITEGLEADTNGRYYTDESGVKHYFLGWSVSAAGGDIIAVGGEVRINSANVTLYAVWSAERYHVVYDMNGGSGTVPDEYAGKIYAFGENAALYIPLADERPTKDDVVFVGWSETVVNDALTAPPDYGTIITSVAMQNGDKTVYAVWAEDKNGDNVPDYADNMYLVKYHTNGGTFPNTTNGIFLEDYTRYRLSGQTAELISIDEGRQRVMRSGAVLVGWGKTPHSELVASAAELAELSADSAYLTFADSDITVYALWAADENGNSVPDYEEKTYTLTYDPNGGDGSVPEPVTGLLDGDVVTLDREAAPTMTGCEFLGWCDDKIAVTDESGSPMIFTEVPDGVVKESVTIAGADVTVYAVWKKIPIAEYGVVYNANGGNDSVPIDEKTYPIGGGVQLMDRGEMTREGAVFLGWSKNAHEQIIMTQDELSERILPAGEILPLDLGDNSSVMTLFAVWGIDITDGTHTVVEDGTADYYQVFYNSNAGREEVSGMPEADTNSYIDGTDVDIKPSEPVREGYNFLGWSLNDPDGDPIGESAFRKSAGPDVLYAVWEAIVPPDEYGVIYRENHATYGVVPFDDNKYVIDGTDNVPVLGNDGEPELVKEGAAFLGWSKKANNVVVTRFDAENAGILEDHTRIDSPPASGYMNLYAVWAKDENGDGTADYVQAIFDDGVDDGAAATVTDMPDAITGERGEVYEIPAREPVREGYVFDGWTVKGTDGPVYRYGGVNSSFTMPDDGIVFVAQWSKYQPQPSPSPTSEPTAEPTDAPATSTPTAEPTDAPATSEPTAEPTDAPATSTPEPAASESPSPSPTKKPGGGSGGSGGGGGGGGFGTASVRVVKEWDDDNNSRGERPTSITIKLMQNGNAVDQCVLSAENNWQHTFSNLKTGTDYTVIEEAVNHYAPKYESISGGYKVVNSYDESVVVAPPNGGGGSGGKAPDDLPTLNYDDHYAYIVGYEDGTVQPEGTITRAEVATIFFRMLSESSRDRYMTKGNKFSDVSVGKWFNTAVSTMAAADIVHGYEDGTFRGDDPITRAEFAVIAANFDSSAYDGPDKFSDTGEHWASEHINRAAERGWINGYEDGTFKPDQSITRAEAMALVNRVLERKPSADHMLDDMIVWPDNSDKTKWYYADVQEATNSHYSERGDGGYEIWTSLRPVMDWASLEI